MADLEQGAEGALRRADVALRTTGGQAVLLRMPQPAANGDDAEQLGLATPAFSDVELAPAAFRKSGKETILIISATAVASLTGSLLFDSADVLFATAVGLIVNGVLFDLVGWTAAQSNGRTYAYYVSLQRTAVQPD
jgi:hypothetical protein